MAGTLLRKTWAGIRIVDGDVGDRENAMKRCDINQTIGICGLIAFLAAASFAWAEDNPFTGRWHWNRELSKLPSSESVPGDTTLDISRVDSAHVRWSITIANAQGHTATESFDTPANGEFYPISSDTTASFRLTGATLEAIFKGPSGEADALSCALSADRKKMTCNGTLTGEDGKTEAYVDVYDRR